MEEIRKVTKREEIYFHADRRKVSTIFTEQRDTKTLLPIEILFVSSVTNRFPFEIEFGLRTKRTDLLGWKEDESWIGFI